MTVMQSDTDYLRAVAAARAKDGWHGQAIRLRKIAEWTDDTDAEVTRRVLAEVRDRLEESGQLAAAVFVGRMITKEQQQ